MINKVLIRLSQIVITGLIIFGVYYLFVINSKGTDQIFYLKPESDFQTLQDFVNHPALKNKVVYADFWHTGCHPCLEGFKTLHLLKEKFAEDADIAFLYLGKDRSVPGEKFRWKKLIEKMNVTGYHYFMSYEKYDQLWYNGVPDSSLQQVFPHYFLFDKNGVLIDNNAPKPKSPELIQKLNELLEDK